MRDRLDIIHFNMIQRCTNPNSTYFPVTADEVLPFATNGEHGTTSRNGLCHTATVMT